MASRESEDQGDQCGPPSAKTRKLEGAASYKSKFNVDWKKEFDFITNVPGDPYRQV